MLVFRVAEPGKPTFQLRKGEQGISVFIPDSVQPPLADAEIVGAFRPGSMAVVRTLAEIEAKGLQVVAVPGCATRCRIDCARRMPRFAPAPE